MRHKEIRGKFAKVNELHIYEDNLLVHVQGLPHWIYTRMVREPVELHPAL